MRKDWRIYRTRPKTVSAMFSEMKSVGIDPDGLSLGTSRNSHSAPLGKNDNWTNPEELPAFSGVLHCSKVKKFKYVSFDKPWDKLWWIHSGTGGGDGNGKWFGSFVIWCEDVPEVTREWKKKFGE